MRTGSRSELLTRAPLRWAAWRMTAITGVLAGALVLASPAVAAISAAVSVQTTAGTRIVVTLTSSKSLSAKQRPVGVSVRAGGTTFKLRRGGGASAAAVRLGTWSTGLLKGSLATKALALRGKQITVVVRLAHGSMPIPSTVAGSGALGAPGGITGGGTTGGGTTGGGTTGGGTTGGGTTGGGTTGGTPLFTPPGKELTGQAAFDSFKRYFVNSEFSDCQGGHWGPGCSVENRYEHGGDWNGTYGTFEYRRCTPTSGADINFVDYYTVTGAAQHADGSWVVEYTTQNGVGFYHWEVGTNGIANGYYTYNGGQREDLTGYFWRQPAYLADCYGSPG